MKAIKFLIVETSATYNNEVELKSTGTKILVNSSIENVTYINREVTVVSAPENTILQKGDKVIVHHNILRNKLTTTGKKILSDFHIKDNIYYVPLQEVFMFKRGDEQWRAISPFCFVKPIKVEQPKTASGLILSTKEVTHKGMEKNRGILHYSNEILDEMGVFPNDKVIFSDYSEYEFTIDGELLYKMSVNDILAKVD